jgi:hypothetical protein
MPEIRSTDEDPVQLYDGMSFVSKQDVASGETATPAWTISGQDNYVIGIEQNTPFALEAYEATNQTEIDQSTRFTIQKTDPQDNPLGNAIVAQGNFNQFDYDKMRSDPDYFLTTAKSLVLDERENVHIYLDIPSGANDFDASASRLTIGDNVTQTGKPVFIRKKNSLNSQQQQAVQQASSANS